jgi:UDP-3-O-acyl-N-acetylglucosamine deacetylase
LLFFKTAELKELKELSGRVENLNNQKTIKSEFKISGKGLAAKKQSDICPPVRPGIVFIRTDLDSRSRSLSCRITVQRTAERPAERVGVCGNVRTLPGGRVAMDIDNLIIEIEGNELPGCDGSADDYFKALQKPNRRAVCLAERNCHYRADLHFRRR